MKMRCFFIEVLIWQLSGFFRCRKNGVSCFALSIINHRHFSFPLFPQVRFGNQSCHEVCHVYPTGFSRIKKRTSCGRSIKFVFGNF